MATKRSDKNQLNIRLSDPDVAAKLEALTEARKKELKEILGHNYNMVVGKSPITKVTVAKDILTNAILELSPPTEGNDACQMN
tara:strand:- start:302 stop:550 length:249 start_codon:yes stop_codon:yes gene_type:complete